MHYVVNSFNSGELTPYMTARQDFEKYSGGCQLLENFTVMPWGGVENRAGSRFIAACKYHDKVTRLLSFSFNVEQTYILEFGVNYIRFYMNGGQIDDSDGEIYEIATPYEEDELFGLRLQQSADILYILHGNHQVHKLLRHGHADWELVEFESLSGPFLDENSDPTKTVIADAKTGVVNLTASSEIFLPEMVGGLFQLNHPREDGRVYEEFIGYAKKSTYYSSGSGTAEYYMRQTWTDISELVYAGVVYPKGTIGALAPGECGYGDNDGIGEDRIYIRMADDSNPYYSREDLVIDGCTEAMYIKGGWSISTGGSWRGTLHLDRSFDNGETWETYRIWASTQDRNIEDSGYENEDGVMYRLRMADWTNPDELQLTCKASLDASEGMVNGVVRLDSVANGLTATGTVLTKLGSMTASSHWAFGAWSSHQGYPSCGTIYQDRMCFGATREQPQTLWLSATGDYEDFLAGTLADKAMTFTINTGEINPIKWLKNKSDIIIGTSIAEGLFKPLDADEPLTADNRTFSLESLSGSADVDAVRINDVVLFAQRHGEAIRELSYSFEKDGYSAPNMNILAEHVLKGGVKELAYQQIPASILWCVHNNGELCGFTYERSQNVTAWHRHKTAGKYKSAEVISETGNDELWVVVERTLGGETKQYVEQFADRRSFATQVDSFFVDCGLSYNGSAVTTVSGLEHLEGELVQVLADGAVHPPRVVSGGEIELDYAASVIHVGLEYHSKLQTMPLEVQSDRGVSFGGKKHLSALTYKLYESGGGQAGADEASSKPFIYVRGNTVMDQALPLYTGLIDISASHNFSTEVAPILIHSEPLPMTVLAVMATIDFREAR